MLHQENQLKSCVKRQILPKSTGITATITRATITRESITRVSTHQHHQGSKLKMCLNSFPMESWFSILHFQNFLQLYLIMRQMCDESLAQWRVVNIDMLLPYDGSKSVTIVAFYATDNTRKSPLESDDPLFIAAADRVSSALRRSLLLSWPLFSCFSDIQILSLQQSNFVKN